MFVKLYYWQLFKCPRAANTFIEGHMRFAGRMWDSPGQDNEQYFLNNILTDDSIFFSYFE